MTGLLFLTIVAALLIFVGLPVLGSLALNTRLHRIHPESLPFAWGYWLALMCFITPVYVVGSLDQGTDSDIKWFVFLSSAAIFTPLGLFALKRERWAFVAITILFFNPIIWLINLFYLKNRWNEFLPLKLSSYIISKESANVKQPSHWQVKITNGHISASEEHYVKANREFDDGIRREDLWVQAYAAGDGEMQRKIYLELLARDLVHTDLEAENNTNNPRRKKWSSKYIYLLALLPLLATGYIFYLKPKPINEDNTTSSKTYTQSNKTIPQATPKIGSLRYLPLDPIAVELADPSGARHVQIGITLKFSDDRSLNVATQYSSRIASDISITVSHFTASQLLTEKGKKSLKKSIRKNVVNYIPKEFDPTVDVLYSSFLVQ